MSTERFLVLHSTIIDQALRLGVATMIGEKPYWMGFTLTTPWGRYGYCSEHGEKEPCSQCAADDDYWKSVQR